MKRYILSDAEEAVYRASPRIIRPSKVGEEIWEGDWRDGEAFSVRQQYELAVLGFDQKVVDRLDVIAPGDPRRIYLPGRVGISGGQIVYFHRRLTCPIIGSRGDRVHIITPSGAKKLVYPNGELSRPRARRAA